MAHSKCLHSRRSRPSQPLALSIDSDQQELAGRPAPGRLKGGNPPLRTGPSTGVLVSARPDPVFFPASTQPVLAAAPPRAGRAGARPDTSTPAAGRVRPAPPEPDEARSGGRNCRSTQQHRDFACLGPLRISARAGFGRFFKYLNSQKTRNFVIFKSIKFNFDQSASSD